MKIFTQQFSSKAVTWLSRLSVLGCAAILVACSGGDGGGTPPVSVKTTLYSFNSTNGGPNSLIQATDGNFYGTTVSGGINRAGTIFKITPDGTQTTLHAFRLSTDGATPSGEIIQASDGNFYGTTTRGGANNGGTIFSITPTGTFTTLYSFASNDTPGGLTEYTPLGSLTFFGTTETGGDFGKGSIFAFSLSNNGYNTVTSFAGGTADGANPRGRLLLVGNDLYGTTLNGGTVDGGTIFKFDGVDTTSILYSFTGGSEGAFPQTGLVYGNDGNLYGTSGGDSGQTGNQGTFFTLSPTNVFTTLASFGTGADGLINPYAPLIQASNGNFYGTTLNGSATGMSTLFQASSQGDLVTLYSFVGGTDGSLAAKVIEGQDGSLYGVTPQGGDNGFGTLFRFGPQ